MKNELLPYYERELFFIRQSAAEFAAEYPERAGRLRLHADVAADPHVERLIESFALIAGRIQHKIDDEFPEITEAVLGILYPHYLRPVPPMSVAQFVADPEQRQTSAGYHIKSGATLFAKAATFVASPDEAAPCYFRTCYPLTLWPLEVTAASFVPSASVGLGLQARSVPFVIRIGIRVLGGFKFSDLTLDRLRFFLGGEPQTAFLLYELLFNSASSVVLRGPSRSGQTRQVVLPKESIAEVGFGRDEGILPYSERSFLGYRLLQEYFSFPQKFLFFDLTGLDAATASGFEDTFEVLIPLSDFERKDAVPLLVQALTPASFMLGCSPVVNLFERCAEPIRLTQTKTEYPVIPDLHFERTTEVYSVDRVLGAAPFTEEHKEYRPFYSLRHSYGSDTEEIYWHTTRRQSGRQGDRGADVFISFLEPDFRPHLPPEEILTAHVTCTNRDQVEAANWTRSFGELQMEAGSLAKIRFVLKPSRSLRAPARRGLQWRLISHLALNHLSIVDEGAEALREILRLYNFSDNPATTSQIEGLQKISSYPETARILSEHGLVFTRGLHTTVEFDEHRYDNGGLFLFGSVLEKFLALYSSINSFSKLSVVSRQRQGVIKIWPPRAGEQILL